MFPGYCDRLLNEVRKEAEAAAYGDVRIRIHAAPNRKELCWVGGSILASLAAFKSMWVTREEYEEHGVNIVHRKRL